MSSTDATLTPNFTPVCMFAGLRTVAGFDGGLPFALAYQSAHVLSMKAW